MKNFIVQLCNDLFKTNDLPSISATEFMVRNNLSYEKSYLRNMYTITLTFNNKPAMFIEDQGNIQGEGCSYTELALKGKLGDTKLSKMTGYGPTLGVALRASVRGLYNGYPKSLCVFDENKKMFTPLELPKEWQQDFINIK